MLTISKDQDVFTVVVVFSVEPSNQNQLIEDIKENLESVVKKFDGFISSAIHKSLDGSKVLNYIQWKTGADFETYIKNAPRFSTAVLSGPPSMISYVVDFDYCIE